MEEMKSGTLQCKPEPQQRSEDERLGGNIPDQQSKEGLARLLRRERVDRVSYRGAAGPRNQPVTGILSCSVTGTAKCGDEFQSTAARQ